MYQWFVFAHVLGVFGFLLAHGTAAAVAFVLRSQRKVERVRQRLEALNASTKRLSLEFSKVVGKFCPGLARRPFPVNRYVRHACDCAEPQIIRCS